MADEVTRIISKIKLSASDIYELKDKAARDNLDTESSIRQNMDSQLQNQIDAITSQSDVVDIVAIYDNSSWVPSQGQTEDDRPTDLVHYVKPIYKDDIVKVLSDETYGGAISYYRLTTDVEPPAQPQPPYTWSYIGSQGPFYNTSEIDTLLRGKQATINDLEQIRQNAATGSNHSYLKNNPHEVTAVQIGAIAEPEQEGTAGQILATDGQGSRYWKNDEGIQYAAKILDWEDDD